MSEAWTVDAGDPAPQSAPLAEAVTAGALLRRAREASGLHVAALAVALKVPVRKLEALETDRHEVLSDAVFVRALASSVCRTLKIDPQPILDRLPQTTAPRLIQDNDGLNAPFRAPADGVRTGWLEQLSKPVILSVFGLLLGALVLILLPRVQYDGPAGEGTTAEVRAPVAESPAPIMPQPVAAPPPVAAAQPQGAIVPASLPVAAERAAVSTPAPVSVATVAPAEAASVAGTAAGIVVFRAKGASWVEVTDAKGVVALRRLMAAGESGAASGALPLQVTVGRVDVTEVQVRGKPFNLRPVSKDNVARFEVK